MRRGGYMTDFCIKQGIVKKGLRGLSIEFEDAALPQGGGLRAVAIPEDYKSAVTIGERLQAKFKIPAVGEKARLLEITRGADTVKLNYGLSSF